MKTNLLPTLAVAFSLGTLSTNAESIRLNDGTVIEGNFAAPTHVTIQTPLGDRAVPFAPLPVEIQKVYWNTEQRVATVPAPATPTLAPVTDEEIASLAAAVNLEIWSQVASIGSFRDKGEKRGSGGLVVTKAFNAIEENWASVYGEDHPLGAIRSWSTQVAAAKALLERNPQFLQRRWLERFIRAGEAVEKRDSNEFATAIRELKKNALTASALNAGSTSPVSTVNPENSRNFFPAK
ncbi:MAG: hypothetical protein ABI680_15065 [Chthoniobacteraceae bacterium]